jgi:hypothetical protein
MNLEEKIAVVTGASPYDGKGVAKIWDTDDFLRPFL